MRSEQDPSNKPEDEESAEGNKRSRADWWKPTSQERKILKRFLAVLAALSIVITFVGYYAHGATAILAWSVGLLVVVPIAIVAFYRAIHIRVKLPITIVLSGIIVTVIAGAVVGHIIRAVVGPSMVAAIGAIVTPRDGAIITGGALLSVSGTVQDLPPGYRLDLFLKFPHPASYYAAGDPNTTLTITDGRWSGAIYIGAQEPCTVYLVELSPASVKLMNSEIPYQSNGYPSIAALGTILASVSLTADLGTTPGQLVMPGTLLARRRPLIARLLNFPAGSQNC